MDEDKASRFISSLVKSIQALCNGFVDFSSSIEVVGHIHLNIDRSVKLDYVLTEEVSKSVSEGSTVFSSHSYHSQPPPSILSSKSASDTSNHGQKPRKDNEADPLGLSALPREVPNASKSDSHAHSSNRVSDSSNSSHSFSGNVGFSRTSEPDLLKQENNRSSCQMEDSSNKRRKMGSLSQRTPSPAAKRSRTNDFSSGSRTVIKEPGFEVIEIKEEPEEEPAVFFGSSASGQDIQTPDFSNVVMESLDRVNQIEQGTDLVGDGGGGEGMAGPQQPVFPVMFHQSDGMSSSTGPVPGPSSDPQSVASTSGEDLFSFSRPSPSTASSSTLSARWGINAAFPSFAPSMMSHIRHPAFSALSRSLWMSGGMANYKPRPRLQYSANQISAAIQDVEMGKSISKAAKDNGVPFTSLYRKVKARSSQQSEESQRAPVEEPFPSDSVPALDPISDDISFLNDQTAELDGPSEAADNPDTPDHGPS